MIKHYYIIDSENKIRGISPYLVKEEAEEDAFLISKGYGINLEVVKTVSKISPESWILENE